MKKDQIKRTVKPRLTFVLVHGTFTKGAKWVLDDADPESFRRKLVSELKDDFEVRFEVADWGHSGWFQRLKDNTFSRRQYGAERLSQHLRARPNTTEADRRYIVAHSHAGNVVLYAMCDQGLRDKVTGVICLSSPFLKYKRSEFSRSFLGLSAVLVLMHALFDMTVAMWAYAVVYIPVVATIAITKNFGDSEDGAIRIRRRLEQLALPNFQPIELSNRLNFLAIRPHYDEVTGLFWITRLTGTAFRELWQLINKVGGPVLVGYYVFYSVGVLIDQIPITIDLSTVDVAMAWVDKNFLSPLIMASTAVLLVIVMMRWSYAFDSIPWIASMDVESDVVPWDGADKVPVPTFGWMKHTNIQNQSPPIIAEWIRHSHQV